MKITYTINHLKSTPVPCISLKKHPQLLRQAIINQSQTRPSLISIFQEGGELLFKRRLFVGGVGLSLASLVLATGLFGFPFQGSPLSPSEVEAQEIVNHMQNQVTLLTPDQRYQIEHQLEADLDLLINDVRLASDLAIISEKELSIPTTLAQPVNQLDRQPYIQTASAVNHQSAAVDPIAINLSRQRLWVADGYHQSTRTGGQLKFLKYTDGDGNRVIIGVNNENLPIIRYIQLNNPIMYTQFSTPSIYFPN